jgi:small redox-active disulfide protein 2
MLIKILGTGCAKCQRLEQLTREVVAELGIDAQFDHVRDMPAIMAYPVMSTPALVIDEEVMVFGRMPSKEEIAGWVKAA